LTLDGLRNIHVQPGLQAMLALQSKTR